MNPYNLFYNCILFLVIFVITNFTEGFGQSPENHFTKVEIDDMYSSSVVKILIKDSKDKEVESGSGFFIHEKGYILTNKHVIKKAIPAKKLNMSVKTEDILEFHKLASKLIDPGSTDQLNIYLSLQLKKCDLNKEIDKYSSKREISQEFGEMLLCALNKAIDDEYLYREKRFKDVELSASTKVMMNRAMTQKNNSEVFKRRNRMLLTDAYPEIISPRPIFEMRVFSFNEKGQQETEDPVEAKLIQHSDFYDVALIKIEGDGYNPVLLGNSHEVKDGEDVYVMGFPLKEKKTGAPGGISGQDRIHGFLQFGGTILPGNSGGPAFSLKTGRVIGIAVGASLENEDFKYLLPINHANYVTLGEGLSLASLYLGQLNESISDFQKQINDLKKRISTNTKDIEYNSDTNYEQEGSLIKLNGRLGELDSEVDRKEGEVDEDLKEVEKDFEGIQKEIKDFANTEKGHFKLLSKDLASKVPRKQFDVRVVQGLDTHFNLKKIKEHLKTNKDLRKFFKQGDRKIDEALNKQLE